MASKKRERNSEEDKSAMKHFVLEDVPTYLRVGTLWEHLSDNKQDDEKDEILEVPLDCWKETDKVKNERDLLQMIQICEFWQLESLPTTAYDFIFKNPGIGQMLLVHDDFRQLNWSEDVSLLIGDKTKITKSGNMANQADYCIWDYEMNFIRKKMNTDERLMLMLMFAVESGNMRMVKFLVGKGMKLTSDLTGLACMNGHLECLKYQHDRGCPWEEDTCTCASGGGHLELLQYAHTHGCPWNHWTCMIAAEKGHFACLQYAHEQGCPWDEETCSDAAIMGHLECLIYAHEHGCPWNETTCSNAAFSGKLQCLKYAHEHGCPWNSKKITMNATQGGHVTCLEYAVQHGCPRS